MRLPICAVLLVSVIACAHAQGHDVFGPQINLRIEAPVYTHMPVWLDVDVQDACLEARYPVDEDPTNFGLRGDYAQIKLNQRPAAHSAYPGRGFIVRRGPVAISACPGSRPNGPASVHRFPLHIGAAFDVPGQYRVRWVIPDPGKNGALLAQSDWLTFTVQATTAHQREAWLQNLLAHRPTDETAIIAMYVPDLLAAWPDARVKQELLSLLCSSDDAVGATADATLPESLDAASAMSLAKLVEQGCLTSALAGFLSRHEGSIAAYREPMLRAALAAVKAPGRQSLAPALAAVQWLQPKDRKDPVRVTADRAILAAGPAIVAGDDDAAKQAWALCVWDPPIAADAMLLLRQLSVQPGDAANQARIILSQSRAK